jgi:hypothetical protein
VGVATADAVGSAEAAAPSSFVLQRVQPALSGLMDGSLSTLAPIFTVALATQRPYFAFLAGLATAIGAGVSMAFSEGLSDTGDLTGRGNPYLRGAITGAGTFLGGILHTLPFLIPAVSGGADRGDHHGRLRAHRAGLDPLAFPENQLPEVVRVGDYRPGRSSLRSAPSSARPGNAESDTQSQSED